MAPPLLINGLELMSPAIGQLGDASAAIAVPPETVVDVRDLGDGSALATLAGGATKRFAITDPVTSDNGDGTATTLYTDGSSEVWTIPLPGATVDGGRGGGVSVPIAATWSIAGPISPNGFSWPLSSHWRSGNDFSFVHPGVDFACFNGQPIVAADSGTVTFAGWDSTGYGNRVVERDGSGWSVTFNHLSRIDVRPGGQVLRGQSVGACGSTGRSTGPHLHLEFVSPAGRFVSPWAVLPAP
jgi:murein DD-endopeptidase MepM/ murein hydrolase activator NlpD